MASTYEIHLNNDISYLHGKVTALGKTFHYFIYCIDGLLIDTGPPHAKEVVTSFVQQAKPNKVFLTHYHEDHAGNAALIEEKFGIPIYSGKKTAHILSERLTIPLYRQIMWGKPSKTPLKELICSDVIHTDNHRFRIVATPGHCPDHSALIEEEKRLLFSGDLYLARKLHFMMREESFSLLLRSLEHALALPFDTIYCAHAGIVPNGKKALLEKKQFLENLSKQVLELHERGFKVKTIAKKLLPPQKAMTFFSLGEISPSHLIRSIISRNE